MDTKATHFVQALDVLKAGGYEITDETGAERPAPCDFGLEAVGERE